MAFHKIEMPRKSSNLMPAANRTVVYGDYKLYFFGGYTGKDYLDSLNIFDLTINEWMSFTELSMTNRPSRRHLHYSAFLPPNYLFIYGGVFKDNIYDDSYIFNTKTFNWEKVIESERTPGSRYGMCGGQIGSTFYILGGFGIDLTSNSERNLDDVWSFDCRSREWNPFNTIGDEKVVGVDWTCVVYNKMFYCIGSDLYKMCVLNTQNREWRSLGLSGAIIGKLERYSLTRNESGTIFLFGGSGFMRIYNDIYSLDEIDGNFLWHKLECTGNIPSPRSGHSTVSLGEILLVVGGRCQDDYFNDLYAFNPNLGLRWLCLYSIGEIPGNQVGHIGYYSESMDSIIIHGGDSRGVVTNELFLYNYKKKEWSSHKNSEGSPSLAYHTCVFDSTKNELVIYGGGNLQDCSGELYKLTIPGLQWNLVKIKKTINPRAGHCAWMMPKSRNMIVFGGFIPIEGYTNELWNFDLNENKWTQILPTAVAGALPVGRISCTCTLYENCVYMLGGVNSEVVLDDLWKLDIENWVWERINITEKNPGAIFGHSANVVEKHIFVYAGDSADGSGELMKVPTMGLLWSLNLGGNLEWSRYKVEGNIPPKRFHIAVVVTNDIVIYGGGPDHNVYQLDRNDIEKNAVCKDLFKDFILPYSTLAQEIPSLSRRKKTIQYTTKSSIAGSERELNFTDVDDEKTEEEIKVYGSSLLKTRKKSKSPKKSDPKDNQDAKKGLKSRLRKPKK